MRCAIYFTPPAGDPLTVTAARWLGRDAYSGDRLEGVECAGIVDSDRAFLTAPIRRYGFHANIKAPFDLSQGETMASLHAALKAFCSRRPACHVPAMRIALLGDFFALVPAEDCVDLDALAEAVVTRFDRFRAPLSEEEFSRRAGADMTETQLHNLLRWGDPNVFEQFRFHMPLTGPVPIGERTHVLKVLKHHFGALAEAPVTVGQLALFGEPEPHAPFRIRDAFLLTGESAQQVA